MEELLKNGALAFGVDLDGAALRRFFQYKEFLVEYNKKVNLTAILDERDIVIKHFLDSLSVCPLVAAGGSVIDIGTGAGFPGVALKIAMGDIKLTLVDSVGKKVVFLERLVEVLGLEGVSCVKARAEELVRLRPDMRESFDCAVSRAVGDLSKLAAYCLPYVKVGGVFVAMKGREWVAEVEKARVALDIFGGKVVEIREVSLYGSDIVRNLVVVKKVRKKNVK